MTNRAFVNHLRLHRGTIAVVVGYACKLTSITLLLLMLLLSILDVIGSNGAAWIGGIVVCLTLATTVLWKLNLRAMGMESDKLDGLTAAKARDFAKADLFFRKALDKAEYLANDHPFRADILGHLGRVARVLGNYDEAEHFGQRALAAEELSWGVNDQRTIAAKEFLARVYLDIARYEKARPLLESALQTRGGRDSLEVAKCLHDLGRISSEQGNHAEAEPYFRQAYGMVQTIHEAASSEGMLIAENLASALAYQGKFEQAELLVKKLVEQTHEFASPDSPSVGAALYQFALIRLLQGRLNEAEPIARCALAIMEPIVGENELALAAYLNLLGEILCGLRKLDEADSCCLRALQLRQEYLAPEHPFLAESLESYGKVLAQQGRFEETNTHIHHSKQIREFHSPFRIV